MVVLTILLFLLKTYEYEQIYSLFFITYKLKLLSRVNLLYFWALEPNNYMKKNINKYSKTLCCRNVFLGRICITGRV